MTTSGGEDEIWTRPPADDVPAGPATDAPADEAPEGSEPLAPEGSADPGAHEPAATGEDAWDSWDEPPPARRRIAVGAVAVIAGAALFAGYGLGLARGRTQQGRGSSPTTSIVQGSSTSATASTQPAATASTAPAAPATDLPALRHALTFDGNELPAAIDGAQIVASPGWVVEGERLLAPAPGLPDSAEGPAMPGVDPVFALAADEDVAVATVTLTDPTGFSGLTLGDETRGWQVVVTPDLDEVRLYEVRDGVQRQRGYLKRPVEAGINLGLYVTDQGVGVVVQGQPVQLETFFGPSTVLGSDHPASRTVSLIAGTGQTGFDALAFG